MKKELLIAASLVITHAYARRAEELCESDWGLSEDSKKFIRAEVEDHCNFIMNITTKKTASQKVTRAAPMRTSAHRTAQL